MNHNKYEDFVVGYGATYKRKVTQRDNELFAEFSGDDNPLHFNDELAKKVGYKARISNGFVTESRLAAALVKAFTSDNCIVVELEKKTRFCKPVYMDEEITAKVKVIERLEAFQALKIEAQCLNQKGEKVMTAFFVVQILQR